MGFLMLGILAFILYYLYDINTIWFQTKAGRYLFLVGSLFLAIATVGITVQSFPARRLGASVFVWIVLAILFFGLLIYTLFFALPVSEAYEGISDGKQTVYQEGMYALCRHPGVLWLTLFYVSMAMIFPTGIYWAAAVIFSSLDLIYVILQDMVIFPRQFENYGAYKNTTPFLLPNRNSFMRAIGRVKG